MKNINLVIDGVQLEVPENTSIIEAAKQIGIHIPTLCYHPDLPATGACGLCVVEIEGYPTPKRACTTPVAEGMQIRTNSKELRSIRKTLLEMILANHEVTCPTCVANGKCELQQMAYTMGIDPANVESILEKEPVDYSSVSIIRDVNKCISCGRCIEVCNNIQTVNALTFSNRGFEKKVDTAFSLGMANSACVNCGQCTVYCPTGALREKDDTDYVWEALLDPSKHVVVQEAPSIRASLGEEFGMEIGALTVGKMYAALKRLGFDSVFDTNFSADLTILEEGTEVVEIIKNNPEKLPVITSCSPGWIKFMETYFNDLGCHVSTAKSPQQMMGVLAKTYYAEKSNIDPKDIVSVSIMPCTAKKFECQRDEMKDSGYQDVDYVLTTREIVRMFKEAGIDLKTIPEEEPYHALADYTGAATIFGATGGVMEAAIRSAYFLITGEELPNLDVLPVRGLQGIKEAELDIKGMKVKVAVAHGLGNARKLLDKVRAQIKETGKSEYAFIEIMACPGGCVGGGGQPFGNDMAMRARKGQTLYKEDHDLVNIRCSHKNPAIAKIYEEYLEKPGSHKAHKLLHTHYYARDKFKGQVEKEIHCEH